MTFPHRIHNFKLHLWITHPDLSTEPRTYPHNLWISLLNWGQNYWFCAMLGRYMSVWLYSLWINLWIRGVKSVDKSVDNFVENLILWITRELSTFCQQRTGGYPHFYPQPRWLDFGLSKADFLAYSHIHRPYYYYYSNRYMV